MPICSDNKARQGKKRQPKQKGHATQAQNNVRRALIDAYGTRAEKQRMVFGQGSHLRAELL